MLTQDRLPAIQSDIRVKAGPRRIWLVSATAGAGRGCIRLKSHIYPKLAWFVSDINGGVPPSSHRKREKQIKETVTQVGGQYTVKCGHGSIKSGFRIMNTNRYNYIYISIIVKNI